VTSLEEIKNTIIPKIENGKAIVTSVGNSVAAALVVLLALATFPGVNLNPTIIAGATVVLSAVRTLIVALNPADSSYGINAGLSDDAELPEDFDQDPLPLGYEEVPEGFEGEAVEGEV
jgi:hypothetical protein